MTAQMNVLCPPELMRLVGEAADREDLPRSEWVVRVLADAIGRPDLKQIPRKRPGRPRKDGRPRQLTA